MEMYNAAHNITGFSLDYMKDLCDYPDAVKNNYDDFVNSFASFNNVSTEEKIRIYNELTKLSNIVRNIYEKTDSTPIIE
jgi:hypothetical protein